MNLFKEANKKKRNPRTTFGIKNKKTGTLFHDIIKAFVASRIITCEDFDIGTLNYQGIDYILHTDRKVRTELGNWGNCRCMISFQIRTRERMAVARIYTEKDKIEERNMK